MQSPEYAPWAATVASCRREFVRVARSFWLIPEIIPPVARDDVALLYCLCRRLDDAVDEARDAGEARAALDRFEAELAGRAPPRALVAAFLAGAPRTGVPLECLDALLAGMRADLGLVRLASDEELLRYSYRVGAAVGLMVMPLLGARGVEAERRVVDMAIAMQLINVVLGVAADARRDRVYLPAERLRAAGLSPEDVLQQPGDARLLPVLDGLVALADRYFASFEAGASAIPLRYRHGVVLAARGYRELGRRAVRGEAPLVTPGQLPRAMHAKALGQLFAAALHPRVLGLVAPEPHDPALHGAFAAWRGAHARSSHAPTP